jgi:hypothetical protein
MAPFRIQHGRVPVVARRGSFARHVTARCSSVDDPALLPKCCQLDRPRRSIDSPVGAWRAVRPAKPSSDVLPGREPTMLHLGSMLVSLASCGRVVCAGFE